MSTKALETMVNVPLIKERADKFFVTIKRNLQKEILDPLITQREKLEDDIASVLDFSLNTDINRGLTPITREKCQERFKTSITLQYELNLLNMEIAQKQIIFDELFLENEEA